MSRGFTRIHSGLHSCKQARSGVCGVDALVGARPRGRGLEADRITAVSRPGGRLQTRGSAPLKSSRVAKVLLCCSTDIKQFVFHCRLRRFLIGLWSAFRLQIRRRLKVCPTQQHCRSRTGSAIRLAARGWLRTGRTLESRPQVCQKTAYLRARLRILKCVTEPRPQGSGVRAIPATFIRTFLRPALMTNKLTTCRTRESSLPAMKLHVKSPDTKQFALSVSIRIHPWRTLLFAC